MVERELTRAELQSALDQAKSELALARQALERPNPVLQAELDRTRLELSALKRGEISGASGAPKPYKGWVRAIEDCHYAQLRAKDDVFEVDLAALWSDDPFVAVTITGYTESGKPITEPNKAAPPAIDFRFRPQVRVSTDVTPLRASAY